MRERVICLVGFNFDPNSSRPLLLAANRDEFHRRPTEPARWWVQPRILAGRDRLAGGTWLALSRAGRLAAVTNVREMARTSGSRSRGELAVEFVAGGAEAAEFARRTLARGGNYGGFNLLVYDRRELWWISNRASKPERIRPGVHALSNHLLDTPWPKVRSLSRALAAQDPAADATDWFEALLSALQNRRVPPGDLPATGIGHEREALLAPAFICSPTYGTRCSTLVALGAAGGGEFIEVSYDPDGSVSGRVEERWANKDPDPTI